MFRCFAQSVRFVDGCGAWDYEGREGAQRQIGDGEAARRDERSHVLLPKDGVTGTIRDGEQKIGGAISRAG